MRECRQGRRWEFCAQAEGIVARASCHQPLRSPALSGMGEHPPAQPCTAAARSRWGRQSLQARGRRGPAVGAQASPNSPSAGSHGQQQMRHCLWPGQCAADNTWAVTAGSMAHETSHEQPTGVDSAGGGRGAGSRGQLRDPLLAPGRQHFLRRQRASPQTVRGVHAGRPASNAPLAHGAGVNSSPRSGSPSGHVQQPANTGVAANGRAGAAYRALLQATPPRPSHAHQPDTNGG